MGQLFHIITCGCQEKGCQEERSLSGGMLFVGRSFICWEECCLSGGSPFIRKSVVCQEEWCWSVGTLFAFCLIGLSIGLHYFYICFAHERRNSLTLTWRLVSCVYSMLRTTGRIFQMRVF